MKNILLVPLLILFASCHNRQKDSAKSDPDIYYTCSMDPQVVEAHPGKCPICHMELTAVHKSRQQHSEEIKLSPEQVQLGNIHVDTIQSTGLGSQTVLTGTVSIDPTSTQSISSRISGRIEKLYYKTTGDPIPTGARLYDLYSEDLNNAEQEYLLLLQKQKALGNSVVNYNDLLQSAKSKLILWGMTEAQVADLARNGNAASIVSFYSSAGGVLTELDVKEGDYVAEGGPIARIANLTHLWVEAQVYTSQFAQLDPDATATLQFPDLPGKSLREKLSFVNPEVDPSTRINLIRIQVSNKDNQLRPGMAAYVTIQNPSRKALSLPSDAVLRSPSMASIWVQIAQNTFKSRIVKIGEEADGFTEILSGLQSGDAVVTSGAYLLQSEYIFRNGADPMAGMDMSKMKM